MQRPNRACWWELALLALLLLSNSVEFQQTINGA